MMKIGALTENGGKVSMGGFCVCSISLHYQQLNLFMGKVNQNEDTFIQIEFYMLQFSI